MPSPEEQRRLRRRELDLTIDHRLGCDFPAKRREALWSIQCNLEKHRLHYGVRSLFRRLFGRDESGPAQGLARIAYDEFAKVLDEHELREYFELEAGEPPALPVDRRPGE